MAEKEKYEAGDSAYEDMSCGECEEYVPPSAARPGDNPKSSATPKSSSKESFVDGPFGGRKPA